MHNQYVIALDQGTTSSRAMLIDAQGRAVSSVQRPFPQIYPHPGWVEHNAAGDPGIPLWEVSPRRDG